MQAADQGTATDLDGRDLVIGIVRARFNDAITLRMKPSRIPGPILEAIEE